MRMVFSVCPRAHVVRSSQESTVGTDEVLPVDAGLFSGDFSSFSYYGCAVMVDPFVASACRCVGVTGGEGVGVGEVCTKVLGGYDVDPDDPDWDRFCRDFLLLGSGAMRSQADLVVLVDSVLNGVVYALTGCGDYADRSVHSSARLMKFVSHLYVLMVLLGGAGVLPWGVALSRYDGDPLVARKMTRWVGVVGRCARGLVRATWPLGVWCGGLEDGRAVIRALHLTHYGLAVPFFVVWKAAVVESEGLGVMVREVVGPAYHGGYLNHVFHEYDSGGVHPVFGWVSGDVMHGCFLMLMSRLSPHFCVDAVGAEVLGRVWLRKIYGSFGGGGVGRLCAHGSEAEKVMALFNVHVRRERGRAFSFCVGVQSVWDTYALGRGEMGYELFCSRLDGGLGQCDERCLGSHDEGDCSSSGGSIGS